MIHTQNVGKSVKSYVLSLVGVKIDHLVKHNFDYPLNQEVPAKSLEALLEKKKELTFKFKKAL